jgi:hypothetical protein
MDALPAGNVAAYGKKILDRIVDGEISAETTRDLRLFIRTDVSNDRRAEMFCPGTQNMTHAGGGVN